jgi:hypothetical protein
MMEEVNLSYILSTYVNVTMSQYIPLYDYYVQKSLRILDKKKKVSDRPYDNLIIMTVLMRLDVNSFMEYHGHHSLFCPSCFLCISFHHIYLESPLCFNASDFCRT